MKTRNRQVSFNDTVNTALVGYWLMLRRDAGLDDEAIEEPAETGQNDLVPPVRKHGKASSPVEGRSS